MHAAVTGSKETIAALMQESAITAAASVKSEVDAALARATIHLQDVRRIAVLNVKESISPILQ